ncbi:MULTISPECIES: hypothetical protein [unclassified Coleofasciculus]|uniref:hypothetical protein n=1 Tax=Cyanophyceae TaxID=3028117 RepID=UPI001685980A|nr:MULTISPECIES: hypothetical protein [unclassified Coleofasciculus]MBD1878770.1 hypothetical protein [Coleofasciculus sp. FACHB-T130]MBD2088112.1 hypothetical protein [Coleofasciculus sp. FACHB-542]
MILYAEILRIGDLDVLLHRQFLLTNIAFYNSLPIIISLETNGATMVFVWVIGHFTAEARRDRIAPLFCHYSHKKITQL